jgi:hypothetical protein
MPLVPGVWDPFCKVTGESCFLFYLREYTFMIIPPGSLDVSNRKGLI